MNFALWTIALSPNQPTNHPQLRAAITIIPCQCQIQKEKRKKKKRKIRKTSLPLLHAFIAFSGHPDLLHPPVPLLIWPNSIIIIINIIRPAIWSHILMLFCQKQICPVFTTFCWAEIVSLLRFRNEKTKKKNKKRKRES